MTKQLTLDEMLQLACDLALPNYGELRSEVEAVGTKMAAAIAAQLDVESGAATFEGLAFAGTCAPFYARDKDQPCPPPLQDYDAEEWTTREGEDAPND